MRSSLVLALLLWQWHSMQTVVWDVTWTPGHVVIWALFWAGWAIVLASTRTTLFYRVVRHPLNLGFLIAFWAAPTMTVGHMVFAAVTTAWILLAMQLEERDLMVALGARYAAYRQSVPMLIPGLRPRRETANLAARSRLVEPYGSPEVRPGPR
jgi:methanethiol S-methyltransferase